MDDDGRTQHRQVAKSLRRTASIARNQRIWLFSLPEAQRKAN
jgi:hypothetical protein